MGKRYSYICKGCLKLVKAIDTVWVKPNGDAGTSDDANPYHIKCAPEQWTF